MRIVIVHILWGVHLISRGDLPFESDDSDQQPRFMATFAIRMGASSI